jgi:subtilase family serine protease
MRIRSAATSASLAVLTFGSLALTQSASAAKRVESLGAADQNSIAHFRVYLPLTHADALEKLLQSQTETSSANYHQWLTPAQFKQQFGPSRADVAKARQLLQNAGFTVVGENTQNLEVEGPVSAVERTFGTQIERVRLESGHVRMAANNRMTLPQSLAAMGAVIPEFKPQLASHVHSKILKPLTNAGAQSATAELAAAAPVPRLSTADSFYYANDLNEAYQFPSFESEVTPLFSHKKLQVTGAGAHIGIVISSVIDPKDLAKSFNSKLSLGAASDVQAFSANTAVPVPTVTIRRVDGGPGAFDPNSADASEASLDTQMSLGTAPGATEIVYSIPELSTDEIVAGYTAVDEDNIVDIASSSFGQCELDFTAAYNNGTDFTGILKTIHSLFQQGNAQGITFIASSGDNGAPDCLSQAFANAPGVISGTDFVLGVENPADDPNVTSVGGTNLQTVAVPGITDSTYLSENADFDPRLPAPFTFDGVTATVGNNTWGSGGGFSHVFSKPLYQFLVNTGSNAHRAVPDVSLMMGGCPNDADIAAQDCTKLPRSSVVVWIGEAPALLIGTSSSAPEMAGVLALAVELNRGRLGNVNPLIYSLSAVQTIAGGMRAPKPLQFFHRDISGDNNGFKVRPGQAYSEVLGNGTLDVKSFLLLQGAAAAGAPSTPSNP